MAKLLVFNILYKIIYIFYIDRKIQNLKKITLWPKNMVTQRRTTMSTPMTAVGRSGVYLKIIISMKIDDG